MGLMGQDGHLSARLHRLGVVFAAVVFAVVVAIALGTGTAKAAPQVAVLGAAAPAAPACPTNCQALARTTGFQISIGAVKSPFVVPYTGKIVAWSIKLGVPASKPAEGESESQLSFFNSKFGAPSARLSVLKPVMKKVKQGKPIYKLKAQAPVEPLEQYFGTTTTFTLQAPIKVKQNQILALTIPTWAPALAVGQGGQSIWQASRKKSRCGNTPKSALADTLAGRPQETVGGDRAYGCVYKTARILYSATIVKSPNAAAPEPSPGKKKPNS